MTGRCELSADAGVSVSEALASLLSECAPRAGSLIITLFGDVISAHGGEVGLRSLVEAMQSFGLTERQVRTAVFRLAKEHWLEAEQDGRRSFYRFTATGQRAFEQAAARVYAATLPAWNRQWTLVLLPREDYAEERKALRRRLQWLGFGQLAPDLLVHPTIEPASVTSVLEEFGLEEACLVWLASTLSTRIPDAIARDLWPLDMLALRYEEMIALFAPVARLLEQRASLSCRDAFVIRVLLIHQYRRILLHTADLPEELAGPTWPGERARSLVRTIYRAVSRSGEKYAREILDNRAGALPGADAALQSRFRMEAMLSVGRQARTFLRG